MKLLFSFQVRHVVGFSFVPQLHCQTRNVTIINCCGAGSPEQGGPGCCGAGSPAQGGPKGGAGSPAQGGPNGPLRSRCGAGSPAQGGLSGSRVLNDLSDLWSQIETVPSFCCSRAWPGNTSVAEARRLRGPVVCAQAHQSLTGRALLNSAQ